MTSGERVWILDTSALVEAKAALPVADQWQTFKQLEDMVRAGIVAMPRLVIREISEIAHPDLPGAWAPGVRGHPAAPARPGMGARPTSDGGSRRRRGSEQDKRRR